MHILAIKPNKLEVKKNGKEREKDFVYYDHQVGVALLAQAAGQTFIFNQNIIRKTSTYWPLNHTNLKLKNKMTEREGCCSLRSSSRGSFLSPSCWSNLHI